MKILFLCHMLPFPPVGGAPQRSYNLLREAAKENDIYLLSLAPKALTPNDSKLTEGVAALETFCKEVRAFRLPSDRSRLGWYFRLILNIFSLTPYSVWKFRSPEMAQATRDLLRDTKFDLVHADTIDLAPYAEICNGIPKVLNHHNVESELILRRSASGRNPFARLYLYLQGLKLKRYEKKQIPRFDLNLTCSRRDAELFGAQVGQGEFTVIPNGTDTTYFSPRPYPASSELVFAGGMGWYPNRDAMIHFCRNIYPLIKKEVPEVIMNIIGRHPPDDVLRLAREDSSIKVHGFVDDTRDIVARSAVYVVPIRVGGGTRLKILDAFACGKAVVSDSVACEGIDVSPGTDILIGDTPLVFANQVMKLLADADLRVELEVKARELAENKYAWTIIGRSLNDAYQRLVS